MRKRTILLLQVAFIFLFAGPTARVGAQKAEEISVSYALQSSELSLHEPIILKFVVKNNAGKAVQLNLGKDHKQNFLLAITRPDGNRLLPRRPVREGLGTTGRESIAPGLEFKHELLLNEWFDFDVEGKYEVDVTLTEPVKTADSIVVAEVPQFHTRLEILPRNPARLKEVCESLTRQIYTATSYEAAAEAALPLSYIQDPIAVPYLQKALDAGHLVESFAINGLRKIANQEAVQILISALGTRPPDSWSDRQAMAGAALGMIAYETNDSGLKQTILAALRRGNEKKP